LTGLGVDQAVIMKSGVVVAATLGVTVWDGIKVISYIFVGVTATDEVPDPVYVNEAVAVCDCVPDPV